MGKYIAMLLGGENRGAQLELKHPITLICMDKVHHDLCVSNRNVKQENMIMEIETYVYIATTDRGIRLYLIEDQLD